MAQGSSVGKGFVAGVIGGLVGTAVLTVFQKASLEGTRALEDSLGNGKKYTREQEQLLKGFEKAHTKTAEVAAGAAGLRLSRQAKKAAPMAVEFAFGALCGGVYAALVELAPQAAAGFGTVYGAALFAGASEVVLPALGWVNSPADRTPVQHLGGLSGNVVYGAVTEATRRVLRSKF